MRKTFFEARRKIMSKCQQLGFEALLSDAETDNRIRQQDRETAHLPGTLAEPAKAFPAKPRIIKAQVDASGTAVIADTTMLSTA
jgi:hypothetical protein